MWEPLSPGLWEEDLSGDELPAPPRGSTAPQHTPPTPLTLPLAGEAVASSVPPKGEAVGWEGPLLLWLLL